MYISYGYISLVHRLPLDPTTAVRQAAHFHIASEETEAQRQLVSGVARRKPESPRSTPRAILLVSFPSLASSK